MFREGNIAPSMPVIAAARTEAGGIPIIGSSVAHVTRRCPSILLSFLPFRFAIACAASSKCGNVTFPPPIRGVHSTFDTLP